jgi:hypothetical protein
MCVRARARVCVQVRDRQWSPPLDGAAILSVAHILCATGSKTVRQDVVNLLRGSPFDRGLHCHTQDHRKSAAMPKKNTDAELVVTAQTTQTQSSEAASDLASHGLHLTTHLLFSTLVSVGTRAIKGDRADTAKFLQRLSTAAQAAYQSFVADAVDPMQPFRPCHSFSSPVRRLCNDNDQFFRWQQRHRLQLSGADSHRLKDMATEACAHHILSSDRRQAHGSDRLSREAAGLTGFQVWASVLGGNGTADEGQFGHSGHVHHDAVCSGSFYTRVPPKGGSPITFSDPRGPRAPCAISRYNPSQHAFVWILRRYGVRPLDVRRHAYESIASLLSRVVVLSTGRGAHHIPAVAGPPSGPKTQRSCGLRADCVFIQRD